MLADTDNDEIPDILEGPGGPYPQITVGVSDSMLNSDGDGSPDARSSIQSRPAEFPAREEKINSQRQVLAACEENQLPAMESSDYCDET